MLDYLPTQSIPGSEAKIRVMIERAAMGQPIFHPGDYRDVDKPHWRCVVAIDQTPSIAEVFAAMMVVNPE